MRQFILFLSVSFFVLVSNLTSAQVAKKVLLEEMSTTLCSFCPRYSFDLVNFEKSHPNAIAITHHAGFGVDKMTNSVASAFAAAFGPMHYPSMTIDRIKFDSVPNYYSKYVGVSMMAFKWQDTALSVLNNVTAKALVTITKNWNQSTREISGSVNVRFNSAPDSGDIRINLYIIEDSVVGDTGRFDYDQKNNYINDPTYPELYGKTLINNYYHRNVSRAAPLGNWGVAAIIPANPIVGNTYSAPFSYILPNKYDSVKGRTVKPHHIKLVGFVSYYHTNTWYRRVMNADEVILTNQITSVKNNPLTENFVLYPNPANSIANLDFTVIQSGYMMIELFQISGKKQSTLLEKNLEPGSYSLSINGLNLQPGNYIVKVNTMGTVYYKKLLIVR